MNNWNKVIGSALLIAGTTIGAGMLALPIVSAPSGFYPTLGMFVIAWLFMLTSAFLILEATLWFPQDTNLLSMTRATLGKTGWLIALVLFALLLYAVNAAYITGSSGLLVTVFDSWQIQHSVMAVLLTVVMASIVFFGTRTVDYSNRILMAGLIISYVVLIGAIAPHVDIGHFDQAQMASLPLTWIIVVLSFAYQFIIPNIRRYIGNSPKQLMVAILIGSAIPLVLYTFWTGAIMGSLPLEGEHGLLALRDGGQPVADLSANLYNELQITWVSNAVAIFSLCALLTSILGVSWSMMGLLYDVTKTHDYHFKKHILFVVLTFLPPLFFALFFQKGFEIALRYGGIFVTVLLGLMPALMVWSGRYKKKLAKDEHFRVLGGSFTLAIMIGISIILVILEVGTLIGIVN